MNVGSVDFGYCTNVHPGRNLAEIKQQLIQHAVPAVGNGAEPGPWRRAEEPPFFGVGLWLADSAAQELDDRSSAEFGSWLAEQGLVPFTLNAFPYHNFHQEVVKHEVYLPTWADRQRFDYTLLLARRLSEWLPPRQSKATISTLPVGWPNEPREWVDGTTVYGPTDQAMLEKAGAQLRSLAEELFQLEVATGKRIQVCLEPEPGCLIDTAPQMVAFFQNQLLGHEVADDRIRAHLGVCHDICHSAVMFESQSEALTHYRQAGIEVGKVQVSSAVEAQLQGTGQDEEVLQQLGQFNETRYLHQTVVRFDDENGQPQTRFFEDLPIALAATDQLPRPATWRVHFHVPIFLDSLGLLRTTRPEIRSCSREINIHSSNWPQWEVETYAWSVLPSKYANETLVESIKRELYCAVRDLSLGGNQESD